MGLDADSDDDRGVSMSGGWMRVDECEVAGCLDPEVVLRGGGGAGALAPWRTLLDLDEMESIDERGGGSFSCTSGLVVVLASLRGCLLGGGTGTGFLALLIGGDTGVSI